MKITFFLAFFLSFLGSQAQTALLGDFDFSQGGYSILYIPREARFISGDDTTQRPVYFERIDHLNRIKKELVFEVEARQYAYACFGSASIVVCKDRKREVSFSISENCHSINTPQGEFAYMGYFPFDGYKFAKRRVHRFSDLTQARTALNLLLQRREILYIPDPEWREYDGKFAFFREDMRMDEDAVEADLWEELAEKFPQEQFILYVQTNGGSTQSGWTYWCEVRCKKSLYDQFHLYKVNAHGWQPFPLELVTYSRE
jgi:hypothetical protein